jgi:hypothetical protein
MVLKKAKPKKPKVAKKTRKATAKRAPKTKKKPLTGKKKSEADLRKKLNRLKRVVERMEDLKEEAKLKQSIGKKGYCIECKKTYRISECEVEITDGEGLVVKYTVICPEKHVLSKGVIDNR